MDYRIKDMTNKKYGRLKCLKYVKTENDGAHWLFSCDCGKEKVINGSVVRQGKVLSCGCLQKEKFMKNSNNPKTHGMTKTRTYKIWVGMKQRCNNPNSNLYNNYGNKGISVCEEWNSFEIFLNDMGEAPDGFTIERVNNELGYSKHNCKWANRSEQNINKSYINNTTKIRNISYSKRDNLFYVGISRNKIRYRKGFKLLDEAIAWRDNILKIVKS